MAGDIVSLTNSIDQSMHGVKDLIISMSYLFGIGMGINAALKFKLHNENPERNPLSVAVTCMILSASLVALPTFLETANDTLGVAKTTAVVAKAPMVSITKPDVQPGASGAPVPATTDGVAIKSDPVVPDVKVVPIVVAKAAPQNPAKTAFDGFAESKSGSVAAVSEDAFSKASKSSPVAKTAAKESSGNQSSIDFSTWMQVLAGLGLLGAGGWAMVIRATRKDKATRDSRLEIALAKSVEMGQTDPK